MAVALIVAAGRGERLGVGMPKALVPVCGRTMLEHSVRALRSVERVREIVVALPGDHAGESPQGTTAVPGGATRSDSVLAALNAAGAGSSDREAVIVHDAARIFAGPELFDAALDELELTGADAVVAAAPVTDTIKQTADVGTQAALAADPSAGLPVERTLQRSRLWAVQTPQVFRRGALQRALTAAPELIAQATDDAWLVERQGGKVVVLPSTAANFKITTPLDLRLAEMILAERGEA